MTAVCRYSDQTILVSPRRHEEARSLCPVRATHNSLGQAVLRAALGYDCALKTITALKGRDKMATAARRWHPVGMHLSVATFPPNPSLHPVGMHPRHDRKTHSYGMRWQHRILCEFLKKHYLTRLLRFIKLNCWWVFAHQNACYTQKLVHSRCFKHNRDHKFLVNL